MSLSEIHWTLGHRLSEMAPDYLQYLLRIKQQDTGQECTTIKGKVSYSKDTVMWTCNAQKKNKFLTQQKGLALCMQNHWRKWKHIQQR